MVGNAANKLSDPVTDEGVFKSILTDAAGQVVVAHFEASWAEECLQMNEVMSELAKENLHTVFVRVDAEAVEDLSRGHNIACVPTFLIFTGKSVIGRIEGAHAAELSKKVSYYASSYVPAIPLGGSGGGDSQNLKKRISDLIHSSPCMVFMKGSPSAPKCGFSQQLISILEQHNVQFGHFDILLDEDIRQGLKSYSDWPTYPQLYVNGELIGGVDIVKEMAESGQLQEILPKVEDLNTRLRRLINQSPIMVFMKGTPEAPCCKFSKALMGILQNINVQFGSFDILEDDSVREGLKKFSNWPTYPQVYVNGELIGGVDIIQELHENGDLVSTLSTGM